jgi:hypothetical protein
LGLVSFISADIDRFAGKVLCYDEKMKKDMLDTVKTLITASETKMKSEIKAVIGRDIRASEDRILVKLNQMKSQGWLSRTLLSETSGRVVLDGGCW